MDWPQILLIMLTVFFVIVMVVAIILVVYIIRLTSQIKTTLANTQRTAQAIGDSTSSTKRVLSVAMLAKGLVGRAVTFRKDKLE